MGGQWVSCEDFTDKELSGKVSGEHQAVKEQERAGQENGREVAKNMVFQKGERRPGKGPCSSHTAQAIFGPSRALHAFSRLLGALTTEGARIDLGIARAVLFPLNYQMI